MFASALATNLVRLIVIVATIVLAVPLLRRSSNRRPVFLAIAFGIVLVMTSIACDIFRSAGHWNPRPSLTLLFHLDSLGFAVILLGIVGTVWILKQDPPQIPAPLTEPTAKTEEPAKGEEPAGKPTKKSSKKQKRRKGRR